ncbi:IS110 family transposase [Bacillus cereus]
MTVHVELQTSTRFPTAKAFNARYVGLTPSESSSGEKISRSSITKQGNSTVRSTLVEYSNALVKGTIGLKIETSESKTKRATKRSDFLCRSGCRKVTRKYHRMIYQGNLEMSRLQLSQEELGCFIWGLETGKIQRK